MRKIPLNFLLCAGIICLLLSLPRSVFGVTLDFESLNDSDTVTNQFAASGVLFSNTIALTAGVSLNEFELPPKSGNTVVSDDSGPITLTFSVPILSVSGFFTYLVPVTISAFDAGANLLGSVSSSFGSNLALSGDASSSPNELLALSGIGDIRSVTITGDASGASFVLDDLQFSAVPEPGTLLLLCTGFVALLSYQACSARVRKHSRINP